jgi:hypothetical protein
MRATTSNFALRLQPALLEAARNVAKAEGVALNQLINVAVAQLIGAHSASNYIAIRARGANLPRALEILRKSGAGNPPMEGDELPEGWKGWRDEHSAKTTEPATRSK